MACPNALSYKEDSDYLAALIPEDNQEKAQNIPV